MTRILCAIPLSAILVAGIASPVHAETYTDRFVWVFGWNLRQDRDVAEITEILETAAEHGINGAVLSLGLDTLCQKTPDYFRRLEQVLEACRRNDIEPIPAVFSVGYGGMALSHNRNLAEGLPVINAPFIVADGQAKLLPDPAVRLENGGFEEHAGEKLSGYNFHDQPGQVSHIDTQIRHRGQASLRLENFTANPHGHGRVMQEIAVRPHRCYRISLWVKTEALAPAGAFKVQVLAGNRALAPRTFNLEPTSDWRKLTMVFNSLDMKSVRLYAGMWGGQSGRLWLDDWTLEEIGPLNVVRRPGTPVTVRSDDRRTTYTEGMDYAPLTDPHLSPYRVDREVRPLEILPDGRIPDGARLNVSWYHSQVINSSQVTVCMAEPELYEIFDHEAKLLAEKMRPRRVLLNMDEVRMGGTCEACRDRDMGELLGECVTRQAEILRQHMPGVEVYVWSDMLDPGHNAHGDYYLVDGDFTGSWEHIPKDLTIAVWGGAPREESLRFFSEMGFQTIAACYYDANDLDDVRDWMRVAEQMPNVRGMMYTPWRKKYDLLPEFGDLLAP